MARGRPKKVESQAKELKDVLTPEQIEAIMEMNNSTQKVLDKCRHLMSPSFSDVVNLDDSFVNFHYAFRGVIHND